MAALIGYLKGQAGEVSRIGSKNSSIKARLEIWHGAITTCLRADGTFSVDIGGKNSSGTVRLTGNVDTGKAKYHKAGH